VGVVQLRWQSRARILLAQVALVGCAALGCVVVLFGLIGVLASVSPSDPCPVATDCAPGSSPLRLLVQSLLITGVGVGIVGGSVYFWLRRRVS
jgi:hypothetical protein